MLRNAIEILAENYDTPIEQLEDYKNIIEENLEDPELYNIIQEQFRPTILKIGTAGAYLWGCDQNFYGNVSKSCSPLCSGSINYNNEAKTCQYQIWTYDTELSSKDKVSSNIAYIYVSKNWISFKKSDIETLKNSNVEFVSVFRTENSKHDTIIPITNVDSLPILDDLSQEEIKLEDRNYNWIYIFLVMIILTMIVVWKYEEIINSITKPHKSE